MAAGQVQTQWKQLKGSLKDRWERFTDEDVKGLKGKTDELVSKVQERYGLLKDEAERQVADWVGMVKAEVGRVSRPRRAASQRRRRHHQVVWQLFRHSRQQDAGTVHS